MELSKKEVLKDYRIANESRQISLLGRREVLTGKAKFGIFGDGKEVAQLAMAKVFQKGDWRSGYYRDQTFMLAAGMLSMEEFFAMLYGDTDIDVNPANGGRMMNNHFATRILDESGLWKDLTQMKISSADISPTAGQMPRLLGLALASKVYKKIKNNDELKEFSVAGNEVAFGTIGDASTSEGLFFETMNAAGVLQVPMLLSVWDDGYGISVPKEYQTTKADISEIFAGFEPNNKKKGIKIFKTKGWDYVQLCNTYKEAVNYCRKNHSPVLIHVFELTQPQGHSTSGSHERYKSKERLQWEEEFDCIKQMRLWILKKNIASEQELDQIEQKAIQNAREAKNRAWKNFQNPIKEKRDEFVKLVNQRSCHCAKTGKINALADDLYKIGQPIRKDIIATGKKILRLFCTSCETNKPLKKNLSEWLISEYKDDSERYSSCLYSNSEKAALKVEPIEPDFDDEEKWVNGREILRENFDYILSNNPAVIIFGEDVGKIGGVNQTYEGLQKKHGDHRIFDTAIREATIIGQGIGMAMRGLRPIAEIQYFDYLLYALQVISDDLATLQYRTKGGQKAPMIISTRGHRLEGIWHSGSPLSMVINSIRGVYVLVPRDMTRAAGFYNTMLKSDDPALIIEPLNGYRLKEKMPNNIGQYTIPLGKPEVIIHGTDITIVTYGSCVRIALEAVEQLNDYNISAELIDVQTLIPFDLDNSILLSLKKTNKIIFFDEDVPGGATAFMMQKVLEEQGGYKYLDSKPVCITGKEHRAAYSSDGDYFSNPNAEDVFDTVYNIMNEYNPKKYIDLYAYRDV